MKLIHLTGNTPAHVGDRVVTARGEIGVLKGWTTPQHSGSTGRVCVQFDGQGFQREFFPSVVNCKFTDGEEAY